MRPAGFELAVPASECPQTHALDHAAISIGNLFTFLVNYNVIFMYFKNSVSFHHETCMTQKLIIFL
jgi:hypothetical protein